MNAHRPSGDGGKASRGTLHILIARVAGLVSGFGVSVILARVLGPEQFGVYGVVMSVLVWLERLLSAGLPSATATLLPRHYGTDTGTDIEQAARVLLVGWSIVLFVVCWALWPSVARYFGIPSETYLFRLASLNILLMSLFFAYDGILNGRQQFRAQAALVTVQSLVKLAGILALALIGFSVAAAFVSHLVATLATVLFVVARFPLRWSLPSSTTVQSMVRVALPIGVYEIALFVVFSLSLWQLTAEWQGTGEVIGFFVVGLNLTRSLLLVPSTVTGVMYAFLSRAIASGDQAEIRRYVHGATRFALLITAPGCLLLAANADGVLTLFYGEAYRAAGTILGLLCVAFACVAFLDIFFRMLQAAGRFRLPMVTLLMLIPLLAGLDVWLIRVAGGEGAALALAIDIGVGTAIGGLSASRHFGSLLPWPTFVRVLAACGFIGVLTWLIPADGPWLIVELGGLAAVYGLILVLLGELTWADLKPFAAWTARKA